MAKVILPISIPIIIMAQGIAVPNDMRPFPREDEALMMYPQNVHDKYSGPLPQEHVMMVSGMGG